MPDRLDECDVLKLEVGLEWPKRRHVVEEGSIRSQSWIGVDGVRGVPLAELTGARR